MDRYKAVGTETIEVGNDNLKITVAIQPKQVWYRIRDGRDDKFLLERYNVVIDIDKERFEKMFVYDY